MDNLKSLGEAGLLARVIPGFEQGKHVQVGPGDDAAILNVPSRLVVTTDMLVEGKDFLQEWSSPANVGAKAAAQNLADVAAMGGVPHSVVVAVGAPASTPVDYLERLSAGLGQFCARYGVSVVGGDLSAADQIVVCVTALGSVESPVLRSGAQPGDVVAVAGPVGRSGAGLLALQRGLHGFDDLKDWHRSPQPPIELGKAAAEGGATSMMDLSDGLARDAARIAAASGVRINLSAEALHQDCAEVEPVAIRCGVKPLRLVLSGGEDHSLLATFPDGAALPRGFRAIGRVEECLDGGVVVDGKPFEADRFDHFED